MKNASHWAALGLVVLASAGCAATDMGKPMAAAPTTQVAAAPSSETGRDWSRIDSNKDGLVSPEEMEKYLAANPGPLKK
ncbi:MAG: hypothetical protein AB7U92_25055 [Piscinibacter sp.]|uniref:hypothetical protein n=1 Tax=Piscinibacter sp. TaxID=1903157 RepID=UPI003D117126